MNKEPKMTYNDIFKNILNDISKEIVDLLLIFMVLIVLPGMIIIAVVLTNESSCGV